MNEKPFTLDDWSEQIMKPMLQRCVEAEVKMYEKYKEDLKFWGWKPPTRYERFKSFWRDKGRRCKDIWTIISGGDIHNNCGQ